MWDEETQKKPDTHVIMLYWRTPEIYWRTHEIYWHTPEISWMPMQFIYLLRFSTFQLDETRFFLGYTNIIAGFLSLLLFLSSRVFGTPEKLISFDVVIIRIAYKSTADQV